MNEPFLGDRKALSFLTEAVLDRNLVILEVDLERLVRAHEPDLLQRDSRTPRIDDECGDSAAVARRSRAGVQDAPLGLIDVRDPHLGSIHDVAITLALGARRDGAGRVRPAGGFADCNECRQALVDRRNTVLLNLLAGAPKDNLRRVLPQRPGCRKVQPHTALGGFFGNHALTQQVQACAAVLGRRLDAPHAHLPRALPQRGEPVGRQGVGIVLGLVFGGPDFALHEATHGVSEHPVLLWKTPAAGLIHAIAHVEVWKVSPV